MQIAMVGLGRMGQRFLSKQKDVFSNKVLAAMRREFGGHAIVSAKDKKRI